MRARRWAACARLPLHVVRLPIRRAGGRRGSGRRSRARLIDLGVFEVSVSDTIGVAHPGQVPACSTRCRRVPLNQVALHFHDTRGTALANVLAGLEHGIATFDGSAGGLGGCPYAPGATGNLATEICSTCCDGLGIETGVSLPMVMDASLFIERTLDHPLPSRYVQAERASHGRRPS